MPCIRCTNGKWKWGERGRCQYDSEADCKRAHPDEHDSINEEIDMKNFGNIEFVDSDAFKKRAKEKSEVKDLGVRKFMLPEVTEVKVPGQENVLQFAISSAAVDRDQDTIDVGGWKLANYKKNPVVLFSHDYRQPPVARSLRTWRQDGKLKSKAAFTPKDLYPFGYMIYEMYKEKFLNATSVGFVPMKWEFNEDRKFGIDFSEQELLEYSAVPVPSNPEALIEARSLGIDTQPLVEWAEEILDSTDSDQHSGLWIPRSKVEEIRKCAKEDDILIFDMGDLHYESEHEDSVKDSDPADKSADSTPDSDPDEDSDADTKDADDLSLSVEDERDKSEDSDSDSELVKGLITYKSAHSEVTLADKDTEWSGSDEVASAEVSDLKVMCTWVDSEDLDIKDSYKLPHHKAADTHDVVWRGVTAAMGALLGAGGGVDVPDGDKKGIYNHLARHYKEFDEEAPEFRFVQNQVLRDMDDIFSFDYETGKLKTVTDEERTIERLNKLLSKLKQVSDQPKGLSPTDCSRITDAVRLINQVVSRDSGHDKDSDFVIEVEETTPDDKDPEGDVIEIEGVDETEFKEVLSSSITKQMRSALGKLD